MKSMTGYGSSHYRDTTIDLEVSVRSVNGRFFEIRFHVPREFIAFESDIKKLVHTHIKRGNVDIYVQRKYKDKGRAYEVTSQTDLAKKWVSKAKALSRELKLDSSDIGLELLLRNTNDVIKVEEKPLSDAQMKNNLLKTTEKALLSIEKERRREGLALKKELLKYLSDLDKLTKKMAEFKSEAQKTLKQRYIIKLEKLGLKQEMDPQRLAQEVVIQVDKLDVNEELTRLKEHVRACVKLIQSSTAEGKKLDFYSQELLREVNTIGSKSQIAKLTDTVVNAKSIIERFREQVQNIE